MELFPFVLPRLILFLLSSQRRGGEGICEKPDEFRQFLEAFVFRAGLFYLCIIFEFSQRYVPGQFLFAELAELFLFRKLATNFGGCLAVKLLSTTRRDES